MYDGLLLAVKLAVVLERDGERNDGRWVGAKGARALFTLQVQRQQLSE